MAETPSTPMNDCGIAPFPPYNRRVALQNHQQDNIDIKTLSLKDRQHLLSGMSISIRCGAQWCFTMPWRLFQAVSTETAQVDTSDTGVPRQLEFHLPSGIDQVPFRTIVGWLVATVNATRPSPLKRSGAFDKDLAVIRAAYLLGMNLYVQRIFNYHWAYIKTHIPKYEDLEAIVNLALSKDDPFFKGLARSLAQKKLTNQIPDRVALDKHLDARPRLGEAVLEAIEEIKARQWDRSAKHHTGPWR